MMPIQILIRSNVSRKILWLQIFDEARTPGCRPFYSKGFPQRPQMVVKK